MSLTLNFGTPIDANKAGRLATLLGTATDVGFKVEVVGMFDRKFKLVSAGTVQTNFGAMKLEVTQDDGGSMVIPDVVLQRITPDKVPAFKAGLKQEGVVLINLVEKPMEWYTSPNLSGGYRRGRGRRTHKGRKHRKSHRKNRNNRKTRR